MHHLIGVMIVSALLSFGQVASADPYEDGNAAYNRGDYATALKLWRPLAEQGNAVFQGAIGMMYMSGNGVIQDYKEAMKWFRLSADQGHAPAQGIVGMMYERGLGVVQDYKEAMKWYRLSAKQGHAPALSPLGGMYADGRGVLQDYVRAHMWLNLAGASMSGDNAKITSNERDKIAAKMTPAQIERAQEMARKCQQSKFRDCGW